MKIYVQKNMQMQTFDIIVYESIGSQKMCAKKSELEFREVGEMEPADVWLSLPDIMVEDFVRGLNEAFSKEGIKPKDQSYTEGKIEVLERYIDTLEKLLSLDHSDTKNHISIDRKG